MSHCSPTGNWLWQKKHKVPASLGDPVLYSEDATVKWMLNIQVADREKVKTAESDLSCSQDGVNPARGIFESDVGEERNETSAESML